MHLYIEYPELESLFTKNIKFPVFFKSFFKKEGLVVIKRKISINVEALKNLAIV